MIDRIKNKIEYTIKNFQSFKTNRKLIVFESDDWGSVRVSSKDSFEKLRKNGIKVENDPYCKYDALESEEDLTLLFELLLKYKDSNGNPPVYTANTIVSNPDFGKIKDSGFENYYYESVVETFNKYPKHSKSFELWKTGRESKVFCNQFHGREHLNYNRWLHYLQNNSAETKFAFDLEMFGISTTISNENRKSFMAAFDADNKQEIEEQKQIISTGLDLFHELFGYHSESFIAPNYTWNSELNGALANKGVKYIQGNKIQKSPNTVTQKLDKIVHYTGQKNEFNQIYLTRNIMFEPSFDDKIDWVDQTLNQINKIFRQNQPAIICTHRLNYIGFIDENNRSRNLKLLNTLLYNIVSKWPNVEFISSAQLGKIIANK